MGLSGVAVGKGIVIDHRDGGMDHLHGMGESAAWCFQVGPPAEKGSAPWNSFETRTSQGLLSLQNEDGESEPQLLQPTELLLLHWSRC